MTPLSIALGLLSLALLGASGWLNRTRNELRRRLDEERARAAQTESSLRLAEARLHDLQENESRLREVVDSIAAKALRANTEDFLKLAGQRFETEQHKAKSELEKRETAVAALVKPLQERLEKTGETLRRIEEERIKEYGELRQFTTSVAKVGDELRIETGKLVQALRKPQVRGRYGEIQLQRVVELAGMREHCDFDLQPSTTSSDGARLRPDMVVRLPNDRRIVIDAKTNIEAYLDAIEASDADVAEKHLARFAKHVLDQARALAKKDYAGSLDSPPEFVVMFIPGDQFIDAALQRQPQLLDLAADAGVILASPSTLIGLLRAVHVGWREKSITDSASELFELGKELHERALTALSHAAKVGEAIGAAKDRYNAFVGSVDSRLMPTLRKFEEKGASRSGKSLEDLSSLEGEPRAMQSLPPAP